MKRYIFRIFLCLIAFAILVNSCGDGTDQEQTPVFKTTLILRNSGGQETTTFTNGEQITFVLTIQNLTGSPSHNYPAIFTAI